MPVFTDMTVILILKPLSDEYIFVLFLKERRLNSNFEEQEIGYVNQFCQIKKISRRKNKDYL